MQEFNFGPFVLTPEVAYRVNGLQRQRWDAWFAGKFIGSGFVDGNTPTRADVIEACSMTVSDFKSNSRREYEPRYVVLRHFQTGVVVARALTINGVFPDMRSVIADDRWEYWAEATDSHLKCPMTLQEWSDAVAKHSVHPNSWITGLLPDDVLTTDADNWRAPTDMEIRCVVGEHSFTGITGAAAAELCGVAPQNFRKYTAAAGSASHQKISFAMWHLLLQRTGVQKMAGAS
jgi:hypothetical protein